MVEAGAARDEMELIQRCVGGDRAAFDALVSRHYRGIYSMLYQMTGSADDASDLTQETFVRAYSRLETFQLGRPFSAWLRRIASNLCIDMLRKRRTPTVSLDQQAEAGFELADTSVEGSPEDRLEIGEEARRVLAAVQKLPEKQRTVVVLRHLEGMSLEEISRCLGMPLGTVKVNLFRARETMRKLVGEL
jgi:RNA polymerase sigma-70 factor, ECF subfamily